MSLQERGTRAGLGVGVLILVVGVVGLAVLAGDFVIRYSSRRPSA